MDKDKIGYKKLFDGLSLIIEAWKLLGLDRQAPEEFNELKAKRKQIGGANGWI